MNDNRMKSDNSESEVVKISKPKLIIIFSNFKAVNNVEFKTFQSQNVEKWYSLYLFKGCYFLHIRTYSKVIKKIEYKYH